jgi:hypothetical protein
MARNQENQELITYSSNDGKISFNVNVFEETIWLTQKQMAELFDKNVKTISEHIQNVFSEGELEEKVVIRNFRNTTPHGAIAGKTQEQLVKYYNLDMIISVGYRVKSQRGTQFRIWATNILKQYLMNGYAINESRIKNLEQKIDSLPKEIKEEILTEIEKKFDDKIKEFHNNLLKIASRPININHKIYNQINLASHKLENKIIELLDLIIKQAKNNKILKAKLEEVKQDITADPKDQKTKNRIIKFFTKLGDHSSDLHKTIEGAEISKKILTELVKLGEKFF